MRLYHIQLITSQMVEHQSQEVLLGDDLVEEDLVSDEDEVDKGLTVVADAELEVERGLSVFPGAGDRRNGYSLYYICSLEH